MTINPGAHLDMKMKLKTNANLTTYDEDVITITAG